MANRFVDIYTLAKADDDFVLRRVNPGTGKMLGGFVAALLVAIIATFNVKALGIPTFSVIVTSIFIILGVILAMYMHRIREVIISNEYENALFAGSMNADAAFTLIIKANKQIIYASYGFEKYFSTTSTADMQGHVFETLIASSGLDPTNKELLLHAFNNQKPAVVHFHYMGNSANHPETAVPMDLSLWPIRRPAGYFILRATPKKISQEENNAFHPLRERPDEKALSMVLEELPWGVYITNDGGHFHYANRYFTDISGYRPEELVGNQMHFTDLVFGGDDLYGSFKQPWLGELPLKNKKGEPVKVMLKQILVPNADGKTFMRYGFLVRAGKEVEHFRTHGMAAASPEETTAHAASASAAAQQTSSFAHAPAPASAGYFDHIWNHFFESSPVGTMVIDQNGTAVLCNERFRVVSGKQNVPSQWNILDAVAADDKADVSTLLKALKEGKADMKPIDIQLAGEGEEAARLYIVPLPLEADGKEMRYMAYFLETTEQKHLEQRFVQAQKMQAVGQLAGGIAHDFNNLLTAMIGFCDLLLTRHPAGDQSFADIMQIKQNATRAANLVRQLLAFSRKQTLQPKITNIVDVLAELSNLIRRLIGENIELKMKYGRDAGLVKIDQVQFEQVIINLAVNARDAMTEGGALTIEVKNVILNRQQPLSAELIPPSQDDLIEDGDYVVIEIADTGHGIPKHIIDQIFEPFFTTKEVGSGTGLGLATVYGIIKQTGGHIYVSSKENVGTKFSIFLKNMSNEVPLQEEATQDPEKRPAQDLTGAGTILLVEDEAPVRIFSGRALRNKGYTVLEADTGEGALQIVKDKGRDIDLIITDVVMPGMTGPSMTEHIMKDYPDVKVIFMSGYAEDTFLKTFGAEREFNFLPKPFTLKQLASKVKDVMTGENMPKKPEVTSSAPPAPQGTSPSPVAPKAPPLPAPAPAAPPVFSDTAATPVHPPAAKEDDLPPVPQIHTKNVPATPAKPPASPTPPAGTPDILPPFHPSREEHTESESSSSDADKNGSEKPSN